MIPKLRGNVEQEIIQDRHADSYETAMLQIIRLALRMRMRNLIADPFANTGAQVDFLSFGVRAPEGDIPGTFEHFRSKWSAAWPHSVDNRVTVNFHLEFDQVLEIMQDCLRAIDSEPAQIR